LIIDRVKTGVTNTFTNEEVINAFNMAKHDMYSRIPSVFTDVSGNLLGSEPVDASDIGDIYYIENWAVYPIVLFSASFLMQSKSKDKYYRGAHKATLAEYQEFFK
jgi:hypothetical protein